MYWTFRLDLHVRSSLRVESSTDDKTVTTHQIEAMEEGGRRRHVLARDHCGARSSRNPVYDRLARRVDHQLAGAIRKLGRLLFCARNHRAAAIRMTPADLATAFKGGTPAVDISLSKGRVVSITDPATHRSLASYQLKPQLSDQFGAGARRSESRSNFSDYSHRCSCSAILSAEDKRFFRHSGVDTLRVAKAIYVDLKSAEKNRAHPPLRCNWPAIFASAANKSWKRKIEEAMITIHLEHKLSKNQIFERYCNLVYLGGDGAFGINGVGEAAQAYFNKDVRQLNLPEAATIAGLIQRPVYFNPFRYPERARLIGAMWFSSGCCENKYIGGSNTRASAAPLGLHGGKTELSESQYFVDAAAKEAARESDDQAERATAVYTTLDLRLQHAAEHALRMACSWSTSNWRPDVGPIRGQPQVALIVLDPHTGEVKALSGGRDYAESQLNRVFAKRPPGSVFKPFVYTAALNTAINGGDPVLTPASVVDDSPPHSTYGNQTYNPANFKHEFMGQVTLRQALAHSLNVATIKVAQMAGYDKVVAHRAASRNE